MAESPLVPALPAVPAVPALLCLCRALEREYSQAAPSTAMLPCALPALPLPLPAHPPPVLAIDLGGSTLRVAVVAAEQPAPRILAVQRHAVPAALKAGVPCASLFDWVAARAHDLLDDLLDDPPNDLLDALLDDLPDDDAALPDAAHLSLGLAFSFPLRHTADGATMLPMGKGFDLPDALGADPAALLRTAFAARGLHIAHLAIVNDSVAALLAHRHCHPHTALAIVVGTGTNATVLLHRRPVNSEWGMFGKRSLPFSAVDRLIDSRSDKPGYQPFEQMTAGRYLGEIARESLLSAHALHQFSFASCPRNWNIPWSLSTESAAQIEQSEDSARNLLARSFPLDHNQTYTAHDIRRIREICTDTSTRAASLIAAATIALLKATNNLPLANETVVVPYTGSVIQCYPQFSERCQRFIDLILREDGVREDVRLEFVQSSGIVGAAVLAAATAGVAA